MSRESEYLSSVNGLLGGGAVGIDANPPFHDSALGLSDDAGRARRSASGRLKRLLSHALPAAPVLRKFAKVISTAAAVITLAAMAWHSPAGYAQEGEVPEDKLPVGKVIVGITTMNKNSSKHPFRYAEGSSWVIREDSGADYFTAWLNKKPSSDVTVKMVLKNKDGAAPLKLDKDLSTTSLRFTPSDWNIPQNIYFHFENNKDLRDASGTMHASATGGSHDWKFETYSLRVMNHEKPCVELDTSSPTISEGDHHPLEVKLNSRPTGEVTVKVTATDNLKLNKPSLRFTPSNWDKNQTVKVSARSDDDGDDGSGTISLEAHRGGYQSAPICGRPSGTGADADRTIRVTVLDKNSPGLILSRSSLTLPEGGDAGSFNVKLNGMPSQQHVTVQLTLLPTDTDLTVDKPLLTFTRSNWKRPQTVSVSAAEDDDRNR